MEHYQELKNRVVSTIAILAVGNIIETKNVTLSLLWFCANRGENCAWLCKTLYPYLNDAHIETALKKIGKEI